MKHESVLNYFLRIGSASILILLSKERQYLTSLSKKTDLTYSHVFKLIEAYETSGIVETEKEGRERSVRLTPFGREIADYLEKLALIVRQKEKGI